VSASVNLPLHRKVQKFSSGTDSPGWSWNKGRKTVVVVWWYMIKVSKQFVCRGCTDQPASMDRTSMDTDDDASLELVDMFCCMWSTISKV